MSGSGIKNGKLTMVLLHEVLTSLRINHEIITHTSNGRHNSVIKRYKLFNENKMSNVNKVYEILGIEAESGNCDSGALYFMQQELRRVRNKDKIVMMFSDGEPTECTGKELINQVEDMEKEGIRVIGIGINYPSIKNYYTHNANGKDIKDMVDIITQILKEYVLEKI
jgi:nitric oxide reductase activation protein